MRAEDKSRTEQTVYVAIQGESEECSGITIIGMYATLACIHQLMTAL